MSDLTELKQDLTGKMLVLSEQMSAVVISVEGVGSEMRALSESFRADMVRLREDVDQKFDGLPCQGGGTRGRDSQPRLPVTSRVPPMRKKPSTQRQMWVPAIVASGVWVLLEIVTTLIKSA